MRKKYSTDNLLDLHAQLLDRFSDPSKEPRSTSLEPQKEKEEALFSKKEEDIQNATSLEELDGLRASIKKSGLPAGKIARLENAICEKMLEIKKKRSAQERQQREMMTFTESRELYETERKKYKGLSSRKGGSDEYERAAQETNSSGRSRN